MRAILVTSALVALVVASCGGATGPAAGAPSSTGVGRPASGPQTVTYCTPDGAPLAMDIAGPTAAPAGAAPAVLYVHGGGWEHGDRKGGGFLDQLRPAL